MNLQLRSESRYRSGQTGNKVRRRAQLQSSQIEERLLLFNLSSALLSTSPGGSGAAGVAGGFNLGTGFSANAGLVIPAATAQQLSFAELLTRHLASNSLQPQQDVQGVIGQNVFSANAAVVAAQANNSRLAAQLNQSLNRPAATIQAVPNPGVNLTAARPKTPVPLTHGGKPAPSPAPQVSAARLPVGNTVKTPVAVTKPATPPAAVQPVVNKVVSPTVRPAVTSAPGDFNGDSKIDDQDFQILRSKFGRRVAQGSTGDLNRDGRVDIRDFTEYRRLQGLANTPLKATLTQPSGARSAAGAEWTISFDQAVTGLDLSDLRLTRNGVNLLTGQERLNSTDQKTWKLSGVTANLSQGGKYELRLVQANSNIVGSQLSRLSADASTSWDVPSAPIKLTVNGIPSKPSSDKPNQLTFTFDRKVEGLTAKNVSLTWENGGNLLTSAQTLTSTDGKTWVLSNVQAVIRKAGVYRLNVNTQGVTDENGGVVSQSAQGRFAILAQIRPSDGFLRMIMNAGHQFMQPERFTNLDHSDGESLLTLGTRINYLSDPKVFQSLFGKDAPAGAAVTPEMAKAAFQALYDAYEAAHPEAVTGTYIAARSVKGEQWANDLGHFPLDTLKVREFLNTKLLPTIHTAPNNDGAIDINDPAQFELAYQAFYREAIGLGSRPKQEVIHFDEVGYNYGEWPKLVELFTKLKTALHEEGVLLSFNLGGWAWVKPFNIVGPNVLRDIVNMGDSVMIEGLWGHETNAPKGTFRTVEATRSVVDNLRTVMDAGVNINLLSTDYTYNLNLFDLTSLKEVTVNGETKLVAKLNRDHHIFPSGGTVRDVFAFENLTGQAAKLNGLKWTAEEVPGKSNEVYLKSEWKPLAQIKAELGISGTINATGGQFQDWQSNQRITAAFALMARNPGHKILVDYFPGQSQPGGGDPNHVDNWWYWPAQLGNPLADYVVDQVDSEQRIISMHRDFANGRVTIHAKEGWVDVKLNQPTNIQRLA